MRNNVNFAIGPIALMDKVDHKYNFFGQLFNGIANKAKNLKENAKLFVYNRQAKCVSMRQILSVYPTETFEHLGFKDAPKERTLYRDLERIGLYHKFIISNYQQLIKKNNLISFLAELENIEVQKDNIAKVVLDERSGTIVAGNNVKILPSSITYGSLNITIRSYPIISQPNAFSNGKTTVFNNLVPYVTQNSNNTIVIKGASNVQQVAAALNSLKVSPRDIIAIFQALKKAGALIGELEII